MAGGMHLLPPSSRVRDGLQLIKQAEVLVTKFNRIDTLAGLFRRPDRLSGHLRGFVLRDRQCQPHGPGYFPFYIGILPSC